MASAEVRGDIDEIYYNWSDQGVWHYNPLEGNFDMANHLNIHWKTIVIKQSCKPIV